MKVQKKTLSIYLSDCVASIRTFLCSLRQKCYNCNQCFLYPLLDTFIRARCRRNFSLDLARASHTNSTQRCDFPKTCSAIVLVHALKAPPREDVQVESGKTFSNGVDIGPAAGPISLRLLVRQLAYVSPACT